MPADIPGTVLDVAEIVARLTQVGRDDLAAQAARGVGCVALGGRIGALGTLGYGHAQAQAWVLHIGTDAYTLAVYAEGWPDGDAFETLVLTPGPLANLAAALELLDTETLPDGSSRRTEAL